MNINQINGLNTYARLSTGMRINQAADDPAGLGIAKGMSSQISGSNQNIDNISSMDNLLKTAEGSLGSVSDSLTRMRELAVQASNGILTSDDKQVIQNEIEQLKSGITDAVKNTEFNTMKLIDGSFGNKHTAMNPDGSGSRITIESASLDTLGIKDFDVTGDFDISAIDSALEMVSSSRSKIGSANNAFEHATNSISTKVQNMTSSMSQIEDADMAAEIMNLNKTKILEQMKQYSLVQKAKNMENQLGMYQDFRV